MANAPRDENRVPTLLGTSSTDGTTPTTIYANPTTHRLLVDSGASATTTTTWGSTGNTKTISDATVTATSIVVFMTATSPAGLWSVVCGSGTFTITSSDSESSSLAFTYKVFP